jgi:DDE_Tnp_1-associated
MRIMPWETILDQFASCWQELDDPRRGNAALHDFRELLMIAFCAVLCGGQGAVDMAIFAKAKEPAPSPTWHQKIMKRISHGPMLFGYCFDGAR